MYATNGAKNARRCPTKLFMFWNIFGAPLPQGRLRAGLFQWDGLHMKCKGLRDLDFDC